MEAEAVHDGYLGKEMVLKNKYDLIILDINLPLINGYDLCKEIENLIINSGDHVDGHGDSTISWLVLDAGADDYITKPFDFDELFGEDQSDLQRTSFMERRKQV